MKGYKIYYLEIAGNIVAQCVVSKGGGRYFFANKDDIVVGPYFVRHEFRGNHYSELLVKCVINDIDLKYQNAYDWIAKNNEASIKCSEKCGFRRIGYLEETKYMRRLNRCEENEGGYYLYILDRKSLTEK